MKPNSNLFILIFFLHFKLKGIHMYISIFIHLRPIGHNVFTQIRFKNITKLVHDLITLL